MRTREADIERHKHAKLKEVASQGAAIAREFGQDPDQVREFLGHYFRHVDADDVDIRTDADLLGLVASHFRLASQRPSATAKVRVFTPSRQADGWSANGATVVQIVTDDQPFLVDSVTMEVLRQGWTIREVFHPQYLVRRDVTGRLQSVLHVAEASGDPSVIGESWMHVEVAPTDAVEPGETADAELEAGLREVLRNVGEAVADWDKMRLMAASAFTQLRPAPGTRPEEVDTARVLLDWLVEDNFTFLGYREFSVRAQPGSQSPYAMDPVPGTGLGILRADQAAAESFAAVPLPGPGTPQLLVITKDDAKARVHRPSYLDYIGLRSFDDQGRVVGERRFLGLFASTAYTDSVTRIPVLAQKAEAVLERSGYAAGSHGAQAILDVLNGYPRDELFQASVGELAPTVERISRLKERRQVRVFARRDGYGRYLSCLVYFPRDRYTTAVRNRMERVLVDFVGGGSVDYTTRVSESVLARLHFVVRTPPGQTIGDVDVLELEQRLAAAARSWDDNFAALIGERGGAGRLSADQLVRIARTLPEGYKEDFTPAQGLADLQALAGLLRGSGPGTGASVTLNAGQDLALALYRPDDEGDQADLRLKIFRTRAELSLSRVLPHLSLLGVDVVDEHPYELPFGSAADGSPLTAHVYEFGFRVPGGRTGVEKRWNSAARASFMDAFRASYTGLAEADPYNALVMGADLGWREVSLLRAIGRYLRQGGSNYSQTFIASALADNTEISRQLVAIFAARFDPEAGEDQETRKKRADEILSRIRSGLDDVASLDHDRIIRSYLAVINAVVRTNFYQSHRPAIALKLLPRKIPGLPEPRPAYEIYVYSPRVEGVHLRFGPVARGGLRWSDRSEDFRTEVLGLVKAQMVKNTVIVPVGAKGGFYCKQLPDPSADRDAWMAEGIDCYKIFVGSLLDVTDNIVAQEVVRPDRVISYDDEDPYLVVAADKGTATFSDIANQVAVDRGYWLGDAFASGGSAGYDHKKMGITARGAWESVRRHFRELGVDVQSQDVTVVGIGDMSGDVFGNGMLLSKHLKLVAAFDHRHIFIDPHPDPAASWDERKRIFDLPRSSWNDYDKSLLSPGGGIFARHLKAIKITDEMREVLDLAGDVSKLSPAELISAILKAPVDLLWNGGVGTYVKATRESHADVGDKANDYLRVNGADLRARCVGEGGNLGFTQLGRIEYASAGGKINTDFIDNSAGVDTSDHEVNIKILLADEVASGRLTDTDRDALLAAMTDEVAELVLANNQAQNLALANSEFEAPSMAGVHEDWMQRLAGQGLLDRELEFLPSTTELAERRKQRRGLTTPELSTLLAYTKIVLDREVLDTDLPDDPDLRHLLIDYFPEQLRSRYAGLMDNHRLHREIIATVAVNRFVNQAGITCFHRLSSETPATIADLMRAQVAARILFRADDLEERIGRLDHQVDAAEQTRLRLEVRKLLERATRWLVVNRRGSLRICEVVDTFSAGVDAVLDALPQLLTGRDEQAYDRNRTRSELAGVDAGLAGSIALLPQAYAALSITQTANRDDHDPVRVADVHFTLGQRLGLDRLLDKITGLPRDDRWETMARAALRDDLHAVQARLTAELLGLGDDATSPDELFERWQASIGTAAREIETISAISESEPDLARLSVGLRAVRSLLGQQ
ncbi:NAD-glutamate dehydrogenase [Microlunatus endophyticus]|uniref:NAD-glutamate dehydrogenase n=1 Tax=Microlunatus endophyticus TaxID=1716077 RepID=A0A917W4H8_9ACTN|nr:NAD-glutamate dehydrogenase [Microlunatus endophyticus]GGL66492.1 NAD-glutamate dehydrogenase [Microlunatus endophyticus]